MEEMMDDMLGDIDDDEEIEVEADAEVDKILYDLTDGKLGLAGAVGTGLPVSCYYRISMDEFASFAVKEQHIQDDETDRVEQYRQQLNGLLS